MSNVYPEAFHAHLFLCTSISHALQVLREDYPARQKGRQEVFGQALGDFDHSVCCCGLGPRRSMERGLANLKQGNCEIAGHGPSEAQGKA